MSKRLAWGLLIAVVLAFGLFFVALSASAQRLQVHAFPGSTKAAKEAAAEAACYPNRSIPCVLEFAPELAAYPAGSMPGNCQISNCLWVDYATGTPFSGYTALRAPTVTTYSTGGASGTYNTPGGATLLHIRLCGAGAGGLGGGTAPGGASGAGGATTFGSLSANGGQSWSNNTPLGGPGGTASGGTINVTGQPGENGQGGVSTQYAPGGNGAAGPFGGGGIGGYVAVGANATGACSGGGGGGVSTASGSTGSGGGAGGSVEHWINSPAPSYSYTVGTAGTGGTAGTSGYAGGNGAAGLIIIEAY